MILNFHGFASIGNNSKFKTLRKAFPEVEIISPTLPIEPHSAIRLIDEIMLPAPDPTVFVGSSFGGFYAFYSSVIYKKHCILVNPSLKPWRTLREAVGIHERFVTGKKIEWKPEYITQLEDIDDRIKRIGIYESLVHFFLSKDDEVLDHTNIPEDYSGAGTVRFFENCGHRFTRFEEIMPEIKETLEHKLVGGI
jgi:uncharacterized protein